MLFNGGKDVRVCAAGYHRTLVGDSLRRLGDHSQASAGERLMGVLNCATGVARDDGTFTAPRRMTTI